MLQERTLHSGVGIHSELLPGEKDLGVWEKISLNYRSFNVNIFNLFRQAVLQIAVHRYHGTNFIVIHAPVQQQLVSQELF